MYEKALFPVKPYVNLLHHIQHCSSVLKLYAVTYDQLDVVLKQKIVIQI